MNRREFLGALGGVAFPFEALAQQSVRRVGVLAQDLQPGLLDTFRNELRKLGYADGTGLSIEVRNASGQNERLRTLAEELVQAKVEVIVAVNTPAVQAAQMTTQTIPIVMMRVADPVRSGLVASLARPGGNVTGLSFMPDALGPKGVELLHDILPQITRMAALYSGDNAGAVVIIDEVEQKGRRLGLTLIRTPVRDPEDYARAFEIASDARAQALFVMDDGAITKQREKILDLATKQALPVVSIYKDFAKSGGLIAYGPNLDLVYRRAAHFVDKLIKGGRASDLPVEQPVIFDVVINLKAAKALGLTIPQSALIRADEVIE